MWTYRLSVLGEVRYCQSDKARLSLSICLSLSLSISHTYTHREREKEPHRDTMANRPVNETLNPLTWGRNRDPYSNQLVGRFCFQ